jgi:hypothetical protein
MHIAAGNARVAVVVVVRAVVMVVVSRVVVERLHSPCGQGDSQDHTQRHAAQQLRTVGVALPARVQCGQDALRVRGRWHYHWADSSR